MIPHDILNKHCQGALERPFSWGTDDCCTFACDVMQEAFGIDPMAVLRGRYDSEAGATAIMGSGLAETALQLAREARLNRASFPYQDADIGVIAETRGPMLAISDGAAWIARGEFGVVRVPLSRAVLAWRVN